MKIEEEIIEKTANVLKQVFARVPLKSPHYENLRELQRDIYIYQNRKEQAKVLRERGMTIREIAKELGYKNPGSVSHLLKEEKKVSNIFDFKTK